MKALYREMCPNCGGRISDERLYMRNPCESCLNEPIVVDSYFELVSAVRDALLKANRLKEWERIYRLESESREIEDFFKKATGFTFWSAQRTWVKRLLKGRSFSIIAPTGMGKSTFGAFMSVYYATKGKKSYIVVPTTPLVIQTIRKVQAIIERTGLDVKLAYYHGNLRKKEKEEMLAKIEGGDYDILITSAQWLARNFDEKLKGRHFDFIFVDDVDAFLKASKNIDRSLLLLGFTEEIIGKAWEIIRLKKQMARYLNGNSEDKNDRLKELNEAIEKLQREIEEFKRKNDIGIMIIASATGSARGDRIKLYRELLGFEVGSGRSALRNVVDSYLKPSKDVKEHVEELLRKLGKGGLIFVPIDQGLSYAEELVNYLREKGFAVELASSKNKKAVERFENGEADYLVGVATYYGSIVRGLDLPHLIRYAVFTGVPKFRFSIDLERPTIYRALGLLGEVMDFLDDEDRKTAEKLHARLRRLIRNIPQFELLKIEEALAEGLPIENDFHKTVLNVFRELVEFLREVLKKEDVLRRLAEDPFVSLVKEEGKWFIEIPDVRTYIQATGRTSRLFAGGITKGLSVLIVDNEKVFNGLVRQMRWRFTEFKMVPFEELDLEKLLKEIDEDREKVKLVMEGKISSKVKDLVKSALMIVESPNKARTIANFFGKPSKTRIGELVAYEVSVGDKMLTILASGGHMFDLVTNEGYHGVLIEREEDMFKFIPIYDTIKRCRDCGYQFVDWEERGVCPRCGSRNVHDALENVKAMREIAQEVDEILIATDPDTEGEKIAWDIRNVLAPYTPNIKRVEFHEVTRPAIMKAIREARDVNEARVEAQMVRRIEDRWIGFELSQELQRVFENRNLSAGRVQTPVLGWIIERYKEFTESEVYFLGLTLENGLQVTVELGKDGKDVEPPEYVTVEEVQLEERELNPSPPYTTDAMLRDASTFLKLSAPETMRLAQDLFELGLITYHRSDSTHVSSTGIEIAREYITSELGEEYFKPRPWGEEGTHEAIRPTRPIDTGRLMQLIRDGVIQLPRNLTRNHYRLYDMIFRRFMTSQMVPAKVLYEKAVINAGVGKVELEGYVEILKDGWTKLRSPPMRQLPKLEQGAKLKVVESKKWKAPKVSLYTQGDIIALMKERGIGRPSTYAKIVQTLLQRYYVFETRGRKKLVPTEKGIKVYHYLVSKYRELVSEEKTRELEEKMDLIEEGKLNYLDVLNELYREITCEIKKEGCS
ncbi:reverse gyrase [Thermococcus gammatolerans]|uniref:Reverse gyrase n=1 Tax=Thermococcus gammatolerans (strain DSM 15229 / JCM 11827 / EJ3) TaxID=593117 RepID=C5A7G9_THEGJ|nr:reverse gyrase [Thermococcus gammatolerans]ACS34181.1 Reverse gyrase (rgy) [Thermococcus gammatolerans EJ3]